MIWNTKILGGTLLIAGITIGAGMLALPVATGLGGFIPTLAVFITCWLCMLWTSLLMLEINLEFEGDVNLISMAGRTLGPIGAGGIWIFYLLLLYSLLAAYMTGSGPLFTQLIESLSGVDLPSWLMPFPILLFFGPFVYFGFASVDYINRLLMFGLITVLVLLLAMLLRSVDVSLLQHVDLIFVLPSLSVVITSFGYHIILPSLTTYLDRNVKQIKLCIWLGSAVPLIIYIVWELAILGVLPKEGPFGLAVALRDDFPLALLLKDALTNPYVAGAIQLFSIFAIITSFLGVSQSLFDFLRDGLHARKTSGSKVVIFALTFLPPLLFVSILQKGFVAVLEYSGVFVSILIGIFPILMVWSARYRQKKNSLYRAPGGKFALACGGCFFVFIIVLVILKNTGYIHMDLSPYL